MGEQGLSTPGSGHSRAPQPLTPFWSWWARRLFKPAAGSVADTQHPFCSGLSSQAGKSAHSRRVNALRPLHKEFCSQARRHKHSNAAEHKDFLYMTSPERRRLFKSISARNAGLDYRRRVDDEAHLRRLFSLFPDCRPLNRPEFKMRSTPPRVDEPFERSA
jgi:hypothetical protein